MHLWNFLTLCPGGGAFDSLFCPEGKVFVQNDCLGGGVLLPSSRVPGVCPGGMVLDEIDTCIKVSANKQTFFSKTRGYIIFLGDFGL